MTYVESLTKLVEQAERRAYIRPCELPADRYGYDMCGRPATVFDLESEATMCIPHFRGQA